jgi:5-(carboxyamino)imidazole ribonucleotide mutase
MAARKKAKVTRAKTKATAKAGKPQVAPAPAETPTAAPARSGRALGKGGKPVVGILTGSPNDMPVVLEAQEVLHALGVPCEAFAASAHRTPDRVVTYVTGARERGIEVIIACAGMAAHLAGVVAAHTTLPVIGVPLAAGALRGFDALLATVQMPPGIPVATVGVDGARNAGFLAARILSVAHPELVERLEARMAKDRERYES